MSATTIGATLHPPEQQQQSEQPEPERVQELEQEPEQGAESEPAKEVEVEVATEACELEKLTGPDSGRASATEFEESASKIPPPLDHEDVYATCGLHTKWYLLPEDDTSPSSPSKECDEGGGGDPAM